MGYGGDGVFRPSLQRKRRVSRPLGPQPGPQICDRYIDALCRSPNAEVICGCKLPVEVNCPESSCSRVANLTSIPWRYRKYQQ
jgi:hypothetical protein